MKAFFRFISALVLLALVVIAAGGVWYWYSAYRDRSLPAVQTDVVIARGSTLTDVASQLAQAHVISNATTFRLLAKLQHVDTAVHAGGYRFVPNQTQDEVLRALLSGGAQTAVWVAIPEGFTASEIAARVQQSGVTAASDAQQVFAKESIEIDGERTHGLEGFLFPSTYLIATDATGEQIASKLTDEFRNELPADARARARAAGTSLIGAVTIASLVEREAKVDADRPTIAGVIYNRLRQHIPLQVDATIEYALPEHKTELSYADLKIDSPYNTYLHDGLPPTPIANPGRPSLLAALNPAKTDMLYYVYCGNGHHVFAKTLAEHQANVARCLK